MAVPPPGVQGSTMFPKCTGVQAGTGDAPEATDDVGEGQMLFSGGKLAGMQPSVRGGGVITGAGFITVADGVAGGVVDEAA